MDVQPRCALVLMTRAPFPGCTKTRMMPNLSGDQCAELQRALLHDAGNLLRQMPDDVHLFGSYEPSTDPALIGEHLKVAVDVFPQRGDGLGQRMLSAAQYAAERGYARCAIIGSDTPEMSAGDILSAFDALDKADVVFGPADDGGYYLVALKQVRESLFSLESYGHSKVLEQTVEIAQAEGLVVDTIRPLNDLDVWEDAQALVARAQIDGSLRNLSSVRYLEGLR